MAETYPEDEREEELSSIAAIYPELVLDEENPFAASVKLSVAPTSRFRVQKFSAPPFHTPPIAPQALPTPPTSDHEDSSDVAHPDIHTLSYLPPLRLKILLPDGYPAAVPPHFELSTDPPWIPHSTLDTLEAEGGKLWEEYGHVQILFAFIDFLQQAAERAFDLEDPSDNAVFQVHPNMRDALLAFDSCAKREKFEQETFDCGVCLEPKKGVSCHRMMRCSHVFCLQCLQDCYNNAITEGDVANVRCLEPGCDKELDEKRAAAGKKKSSHTLTPKELFQIRLSESMIQRYVRLKHKKKLESDKFTIYCPRKWCQGPARSEKHAPMPDFDSLPEYDCSDIEDEDGVQSSSNTQTKRDPMYDRLRICEDCRYAFCRTCLAGWHGDFARCGPKNTDELTEEERASYNYISQRTCQCPECNAPCFKSDGCNHMKCRVCKAHFCYRCSAWLAAHDPYEHFSRDDSSCRGKLFTDPRWHDAEPGARGDQNAPDWEAMAEQVAAEADVAEHAAGGFHGALAAAAADHADAVAVAEAAAQAHQRRNGA